MKSPIARHFSKAQHTVGELEVSGIDCWGFDFITWFLIDQFEFVIIYL